MAYENMTYEYILSRMIDRVTENYPNLDTREGSIIFNALAPAAVELSILYTELDNALNESFVLTASREYVLIACDQVGIDISIFEATNSVHKGMFDVEVPIGSRWGCDIYNYEVTEYLGIEDGYNTYRMTCETTGSAPNTVVGDLIAITEMPSNLNYAKLVECLVEGENETEDEAVRNAYFEFVNNTTTDGNVAQYERWCSEYGGIGKFKIFPLWEGANTVKVSILTTSNQAASTEPGGLVEEFQDYLDPGTTGMGNGEAPIGAFVTVTTATEKKIAVTAEIQLSNPESSVPDISSALNEYFASIAYEKSTVPFMTIGAVILSVPGIESISNLTINEGTVDIELDDEEIPVLDTTNWTVI